MVTKRFNLKQMLFHFSDIGEKRWGNTLQLDKLEKEFKHIRDGREELKLKHLRLMRNDCAFLRWWKMPELHKEDLEFLRGAFIKLKLQDKDIISKLFNLLKNIEIVSCVLRFINPENYGILSAPVENLLNVRGRNQIEKYLNYLSDLEKLKEEYNFERIADVDMALWALANIINYSFLRHHSIYSIIFCEYEKTVNPVKKIMAKNSLEWIKEEKPLFKAELFLDSDYILAGIIAGRELELLVNNLCFNARIKLREGKDPGKSRRRSFYDRTYRLVEKNIINKEDSENLDEWWGLRCDLLHRDELSFARSEVIEMIEGLSEFIERYPKIKR